MPSFEFDSLPATLVQDPSNPPRLVAFAGFLGDSHEDGRVRLYLDAELREFFDIAEADVSHVDRDGERTIMWLDESATVYRRVPEAEVSEAEYVQSDNSSVETVPVTAMSYALDVSRPLRTPMKRSYT